MNFVNRPVRFLLNGVPVELEDINPTRSVLAFLREDQRCTGTKEGCAEGDCGACTVVLGELLNNDLQLRTINACIQFVPALDGKALYTVEYLRGADGSLHPSQQAMVECHGSQCGFCTPGFIMSLWSSYTGFETTGIRPDRQQLRSVLSGNLCRCTGYRTILDAAEAMFDKPQVCFEKTAVIEKLRELNCAEPLTLAYDGKRYFAPHTLHQLLSLRAEHPDATVLAGCTDIGLWVNKQLRDLGDIIAIGKVAELKAVTLAETQLRIGAGVSLSEAYAAIAEHYPQLDEMWERFASVPVRNAGTFGGNIANGSPIGDSMPWLIALQARVVLSSVRGSRTLPLESLYIDYMKKAMDSDEIVEAIELPLPTSDLVFRAYKVSKRYDSDISAVCAAFALRIEDDVISEACIAFGGMAGIPKRAAECEAALSGACFSEATVKTAMQSLHNDFSPLTDMRASAGYRSKVAANLLYRFYLQCRADHPLSVTQTCVFTDNTELS